MQKITILGSFSFTPEQTQRLNALGTITNAPSPESPEALAQAAVGADIVISDGSFLLESLDKLKNVFVTYPYIELGSFDSKLLTQNGVTIANTQGSNRNSIAEWVMFMVLSLFRKFPSYLNATGDLEFERTQSLQEKKVLIVGAGNIGTLIGTLCESFGMEVDYFRRGDDLAAKSASVDLVINSLNCNPTSQNLLNAGFFSSLNKGTRFITFARPYTYDVDGLVTAIDSGIIAGAAIDCDPEDPFDTTNEFYQKLLKHPGVLVTPHVAFATEQAGVNGTETVVANVEAFVRGQPQNVLVKE